MTTFRSSTSSTVPPGRRAALWGTGLDVWEVIATVRDNDSRLAAGAQYLGVSVGLIEAGVASADEEDLDAGRVVGGQVVARRSPRMLDARSDIMSFMSPGEMLRDARSRHRIDQRSLARRAGTTQAQVSRIERDLVSPSVTTLERLFTAMGERVVLDAEPLPGSNRSIEDLRADLQLHPGERVAQAAQLSFALTSIATRA